MALIDKASLLMVPSVYEDGTLYNVLPSGNKAPDETGNHNGYDQTRADFTFSRGSNLAATRVNADGLIEKGRENLLTYSNDFSNAAWTKTASSITSGQEDPNGGTNAFKIVEDTSANYHRIFGGYTMVNGSIYATSVTAKAAGRNYLTLSNNVSSGTCVFNLANGSIATQESNVIDAKTTDLGNGWYRCEMVAKGDKSGSYNVFIGADNDGTIGTYTGDGSSGVLIFQSQLENGLVSTPYIETGATTATAGVLENTPRIDYSSGAGALLLEPQRTNLITNSEYFGGWTKVDTTLTHNYGISPEGVKNSTRVQFADSTAYMYIAPAGTNSGTYASTIYIKGTAGETIKFGKGGNIATGAMHTLTGDWQRIEHITTDVGLSVHISTYGGSTARDMEIYGCQLEAGSYVSSYVPTYGSAATRGADYMNTTPTDLLGSTTGSWFMEMNDMTFEVTGTSVPTIYLGDDVSNCLALEGRNSGNNKSVFLVKEEGGTVTTLHAFTISGKTKFCFVWSGTTLKVFRDGTEEYSSTSFTQPTNWDLFVYNHTGREAFSEIANIQLYDTALSDSEAQTLTTL